MFPGVDGFHWTFGHVLFLTLFGLVLTTVAVTAFTAFSRTVRNRRRDRVEAVRWHSDFEQLSAYNRECRHQITGEVEQRHCMNAFDCRHCAEHKRFAPHLEQSDSVICGLSYPHRRFYHRGHTWVEQAPDGSLLVGLDEIGKRLVRKPDSIELPSVGDWVYVNGSGCTIHKNATSVRVLSPVDGRVIARGSDADDWLIRVTPALSPPDLRHLLRGVEVKAWVIRELERLHLAFGPPGTAATLADGGELVDDLISTQPQELWDAILGRVFLET